MTEPIHHGPVSTPGAGAPLDGARAAPDGRRQATPLRSSLWLWVAGAFLFLGLLWTALFIAAKSARIEAVPLAPKGARP